MKLYCVKDTVSGIYQSTPIVAFHNDAEAKRWFNHSCSNVPTALDLQLQYLCDFDEQTGSLTSPDGSSFFQPVFLCGYVPPVKE